MRRLRPLGRLILPWLLWNVIPAQILGYPFSTFLQRCRCHADGVRSHVGDQPDRPLLAELHPFVELLGDPHGFLGGEAVIWTLNNLREFISGEPTYRKNDDVFDRMLDDVATKLIMLE